MKYVLRALPTLPPIIVAALPWSAEAQAASRIVGLFNIFVGLMLTVAILTYLLGLAVWAVRLGTWPSYRTDAIKIMEWSVAILFTLVVLLAIVQFFQYHTTAAAYLISFIVVIAVIWAIIYFAVMGGGADEEDEKH